MTMSASCTSNFDRTKDVQTIQSTAGQAVFMILAAMLTGGCSLAMGQNAASNLSATAIERETRSIHAAERDGLPKAKLGAMWGVLGSYRQDAAEYAEAERAYTTALQLLGSDSDKPAEALGKSSEAMANYAIVLDDLGALYIETGRIEEAENTRRRALALRRELGEARAIAVSQEHLAEVEVARHHFAAAARDAQAATDGLRAADEIDPKRTANGDRMVDRLSAMVTLSYALCSENKCVEGLRVAEQALNEAQAALDANAVPVGHVLMALGVAQWRTRANAEAEQSMRAGLQILKQHIAPGSQILVSAMMEYRGLLKAQKRGAEIAALDEEMVAMRSGAAAECANCTVSAYGLMHGAK